MRIEESVQFIVRKMSSEALPCRTGACPREPPGNFPPGIPRDSGRQSNSPVCRVPPTLPWTITLEPCRGR